MEDQGAKQTVRYVAFLRGVSPMNANMAALRQAFEELGFTRVRTVLSSGNVVFDGADEPLRPLSARVEAGLAARLPRGFPVILRRADDLAAMLARDPFGRFTVEPGEKRVITFLAEPPSPLPALPIAAEGARILAVEGSDVFTVYLPNHPRGPVFMALLEQTFGKNITTRTLDTVRKCIRA